jgi:hypothetical protein
MNHDIPQIARQFQIPGQYVTAQPYGNGHINDTYAATYEYEGQFKRYIHQRINHNIFKDPVSVMANVQRVTEHLQRKLAEINIFDPARRTLSLIPTHDGALYYRDSEGNVWRSYHFIEAAQSYDVVTSPQQAYEAGKAFGNFQRLLADLPAPRLIETIPDFHHTPKRFAALQQAIEADVCNRAKRARIEIEFALKQEAMVGILIELQNQGKILEKVTHNDTKINNVLLDDNTGQGICVIDLDTVMPGLSLYDFGDMVRAATCLAAEDEPDLSKVKMEMAIFKALTQGYLETAGESLSQVEKEYLVFSGKLITFEIGIRFLTDYLSGDTYFKIHREGHNLDRCRTQFELVRSIEAQEDEMQRVVERLST